MSKIIKMVVAYFDLEICYITIDINHSMSQAPMITSHPQDVEILWGHRGKLELIAHGATPLRYQWYFNFKAMCGMLNQTMYMP